MIHPIMKTKTTSEMTVVESGTHIFLVGQGFRKDNLSPDFGKCVSVPSHEKWPIRNGICVQKSFGRYALYGCDYSPFVLDPTWKRFPIQRSRTNPDEFYVTPVGFSGLVYIAEERSGTYDVTRRIYINKPVYFWVVVDDDDNWIYLIGKYCDRNSVARAFMRIKKDDGKLGTEGMGYNWSIPQFLGRSDRFLWCALVGMNNRNRVSIVSHDKVSQQTKVILEIVPEGSGVNHWGYGDIEDDGNKITFYIVQVEGGTYRIKTAEIDKENNSAEARTYEIAGGSLPVHTYSHMNTWIGTYVVRNGSNKFLCFGLTEVSNTNKNALEKMNFVVLGKNDSKYEIIDVYPIAYGGKRPRAIIPFGHYSPKFAVFYDDYISIIAVDGKGHVDEIETLPMDYNCAGIDEMGRLWLTRIEGISGGEEEVSIYLFNPYVPYRIKVRFAEDTYSFDGTPIETDVYVSAFNIYGERVATNITLTIDSYNAVFSDGSRVKNVTTSTEADIKVPVKITAPGTVRIYATG